MNINILPRILHLFALCMKESLNRCTMILIFGLGRGLTRGKGEIGGLTMLTARKLTLPWTAHEMALHRGLWRAAKLPKINPLWKFWSLVPAWLIYSTKSFTLLNQESCTVHGCVNSSPLCQLLFVNIRLKHNSSVQINRSNDESNLPVVVEGKHINNFTGNLTLFR